MEQPLPKLFSETVGAVRRKKPDQVFLICIKASPAEDNPEAEEVSGGYANCWIDADDLQNAEIQAVEAVLQEGWEPRQIDEWRLVDLSECADEMEVESYQEAKTIGFSLTFYTWASEPGTES